MSIPLQQLRQTIVGEEFDYQALVDALSGYASPRDKITALLRQGNLIRVKKGLYVFGEHLRRRPCSREVLANLIYGPSYLSLDYALGFHGLIPEQVVTLTSVTTGRSRSFATPLGTFSYQMIPLRAFRTGMDRVELADGRACLMAIPEKALADKLMCARRSGVDSLRELSRYLMQDLRIDKAELAKLDPDRFDEIARHCSSSRVNLLAKLVRQWRQKEFAHA